MSREDWLRSVAEETKRGGDGAVPRQPPMDEAQYRKQMAAGGPTGVMRPMGEPENVQDIISQALGTLRAAKDDEPPPLEDLADEEDLLRQEALRDLERSQMPAVADEADGRLVKTIEHYTFADGDDSVNFYVSFDKDLWEGASRFVKLEGVKVTSKSTSLEIRLQDVPVGERNLETFAEWRLVLSPLFSRVEAAMTTHRLRNGKLSVKLFKAKAGPWKKGVKY